MLTFSLNIYVGRYRLAVWQKLMIFHVVFGYLCQIWRIPIYS